MEIRRAVSSLFCLALIGAAFSPNVKADVWDKKSVITFNSPVQIPAVHQPGWGVLPAGTYVFKVAESGANRHIVQIFNKDESTIYATILAIPNLRLKATEKTVITFRERPAGQPQALQAWFYPGKQWGEEFVYPKRQAVEFAKSTITPVLQMPDTVREEAAKPEEPQLIEELKRVPVTAVERSGKEVEIAQAVTPPPAAEILVAQAAPAPAAQLPETASPLPMVALLGLLALGGAWVLRVVEVRNR